MTRLMIAVVALVAGATPLAAQSSVYGVHGIGFPGRALTAAARGMGGGTAAFDPFSVVNPAAPALIAQPTAMMVNHSEFRSYEALNTEVGGLRASRFPVVGVAGRLGVRPLTVALTISTYADRTYDFTVTETLILRGVPVEVTDRSVSNGGITDVRGALSWTAGPRLLLGMGVHLLSGSILLNYQRNFDDPAFRDFLQSSRGRYSGVGVSAGVMWAAGMAQLAASARMDSRLKFAVDDVSSSERSLPVSLNVGLLLDPSPGLRWSTTATYRPWASAQDGDVPGEAVHDTWEVGTGAELRTGGSAARFPVRAGVRYAQLPFAAPGSRPRELAVAVGTGVGLAAGRATVDFTLERVRRDGAGVSERAWYLVTGFTLRP